LTARVWALVGGVSDSNGQTSAYRHCHFPPQTLVLTAEHLALVAAPPFGRQDNKLHTLDEHAAVSRKVSNKPGLNMEESAALYFFIQILAGMEYFHSKKLAHLNMDLSTMVLDKSVNPPRLQLMDRGFAKSWRVANDLTYSRQKWITGSKKYCSLSDSIVDMNRSVKGSRTPGDSRRGSQDALASLNASWQSGKGVTSNAGGGMGCGAVHDVKSSRNSQELGGFDSVDKLSKIARDSAASSGSDPVGHPPLPRCPLQPCPLPGRLTGKNHRSKFAPFVPDQWHYGNHTPPLLYLPLPTPIATGGPYEGINGLS